MSNTQTILGVVWDRRGEELLPWGGLIALRSFNQVMSSDLFRPAWVSQIGSSQLKSSLVKSGHVNSRQVKSSLVKSSPVKSSQRARKQQSRPVLRLGAPVSIVRAKASSLSAAASATTQEKQPEIRQRLGRVAMSEEMATSFFVFDAVRSSVVRTIVAAHR